jgi:hypothetical protein
MLYAFFWVILHTYPPMKVVQTERSEMSAYKIQMLGTYPEESTQGSVFFTFCLMTEADAVSETQWSFNLYHATIPYASL